MKNPFDNAKFIWCNTCGTFNQYAIFTTSFPARTNMPYTLYVSADTDYACFINGSLVGFTQYGDYPSYKAYDTYHITPHLHDGENQMVFQVYSLGESNSVYKAEKPGIIFSVFCQDKMILTSDETVLSCPYTGYRMGNMEKISGQLGYTFHYDATAKPEIGAPSTMQDKTLSFVPRPVKKAEIHPKKRVSLLSQGVWKQGYDTTSIGKTMQSAYLAYTPVKTLTGKDAPLYFPMEEGLPFHTDTDCDGIYVLLDLAENSAGYFTLDMDLPAVSRIDIGYGEHLVDMRVRTHIGSRNFAASYIGKKGRNRFTHYFKRFGMRYLQLHIYSKDFTLYYAGMDESLYPVREISNWESTDKLHNIIYKTCIRTLRNCMHEHYEDCSWREQALYAMDSRNQMLCGYYTFGEYNFARASLLLMAKSMRPDHMLELCSPSEGDFTIPSFSMVYVVALQEYLLHSGDTEFVKEMLPTAKEIMDGFLCQTEESTHLIPRSYRPENWYYYEWETGLDGKDPFVKSEAEKTYDAPLNAFLSLGLTSLADMLQYFGKKEEAKAYLETKKKINLSLDRLFYEEDKKCYVSFIQGKQKKNTAELAQSLFLLCGAVPGEKKKTISESLLSHTLIPISLSNSIFKYEALLQQGESYAKAVFDEIADIWGGMLQQGATTFWETAKGSADFSGAGSLCHGWSAVPAYLYYKYIVGVTIEKNGFEAYHLSPLQTAGLHMLHADLPLPHAILHL